MLDRWIVEGLERAAQYEIHAQPHIAHFLNLRMALGPDFDRDPQYPWAQAFLEDQAIAPLHKIQRLREYALAALEEKETAG